MKIFAHNKTKNVIMKKTLFIAIFSLFVLGANAQDFKPFHVYIGLGYTMPADGGGGILFDVEPAYRLSDQIAVGLRWESAAMAKVVGTSEASISAVGSWTLNGKYYFGTGGFRPYAGVGLGLFSLASVSADISGAAVEAGSTFGFYPRLGFDAGHFNINLDYNIIGNTQVAISTGDVEIKNSYLGIRIGAAIGGGRN